MSYALITGATGVLGKAFAFHLASLGYNLFLTGRSEQNLEQLKTELVRQYASINVDFCSADLTCEAQREQLFSYASKYTFSMLVNVAGVDTQMPFEEYTQQKICFQSRVNFESAASMCLFAIQHKAETLKIINISSMCGKTPMPNFAIYSATKGALTSFSLALREEMKGKGVYVTAVIAGSILTRKDVIDYIQKQGFWARFSAKTPIYVATNSVKAVNKNKPKVILGFMNKLTSAFICLVPNCIQLKFIKHKWSKTRKDAF